MPYYLYRIFKDRSQIDLVDSFDDFHKAQKKEADLQRATYPTDNYIIRMFYGENEKEAQQKATTDQILKAMLSERLQRSPRRDSVTAQGVRNLGQQGLSAVAFGKRKTSMT